MNAKILGLAALLAPLSVIGATPFTDNHPEEAYPDDAPPLASPGEHSALFKAVQEKLREQGFDAGPAKGDFGAKAQTALGQFQLSRDLPASGSLDDPTLAALGVERNAKAQ